MTHLHLVPRSSPAHPLDAPHTVYTLWFDRQEFYLFYLVQGHALLGATLQYVLDGFPELGILGKPALSTHLDVPENILRVDLQSMNLTDPEAHHTKQTLLTYGWTTECRQLYDTFQEVEIL